MQNRLKAYWKYGRRESMSSEDCTSGWSMSSFQQDLSMPTRARTRTRTRTRSLYMHSRTHTHLHTYTTGHVQGKDEECSASSRWQFLSKPRQPGAKLPCACLTSSTAPKLCASRFQTRCACFSGKKQDLDTLLANAMPSCFCTMRVCPFSGGRNGPGRTLSGAIV